MTQIVIMNTAKNLLNKKGQSMIEYVLILAFIALAVIASLTPLGNILANKFTEFAANISGS
ncbi:MAG: hypothetical protein A2Y23_15530 [Clostridiales bacterium GWB2_37_7]|nr:MAG: hypothetical protein A2Y23_15530 [Clostridiales bacterium GWB2_37_7]